MTGENARKLGELLLSDIADDMTILEFSHLRDAVTDIQRTRLVERGGLTMKEVDEMFAVIDDIFGLEALTRGRN